MKVVNFLNGTYLYAAFHQFRTFLMDILIGGKSLGGVIPSKFGYLQSTATQSTDYRLLAPIFKEYHLHPYDVVTDVGCGKGRVLSYLLIKRFQGRLIGVELDPFYASFSKERLKSYSNVTIINGNILEVLPSETTVFYLFNPFSEAVLIKFIQEIEKKIDHNTTIIYCNDFYKGCLLDRPRWTLKKSRSIDRPFEKPMHYSIFEYQVDSKPI